MESIIRGLLVDPIMKIDRWFTDDITKHLFETTDDLGMEEIHIYIYKFKYFLKCLNHLDFSLNRTPISF